MILISTSFCNLQWFASHFVLVGGYVSEVSFKLLELLGLLFFRSQMLNVFLTECEKKIFYTCQKLFLTSKFSCQLK